MDETAASAGGFEKAWGQLEAENPNLQQLIGKSDYNRIKKSITVLKK